MVVGVLLDVPLDLGALVDLAVLGHHRIDWQLLMGQMYSSATWSMAERNLLLSSSFWDVGEAARLRGMSSAHAMRVSADRWE